RVGPVAEHDRRRRERLAGDAEARHVLEAPRRVPGAVVDGAKELVARHEGVAAVLLDHEPRPLATAVARGEVVPARRDDVRVEIDPRHAGYLFSIRPMRLTTAATDAASRSQNFLNSSASRYAISVSALSITLLNS